MDAITGGRTWLAGLVILPALVAFLTLDAGVGLILGVATAATIIIVAARTTDEVALEIALPGPGVAGGPFVLAIVAIEDPQAAASVADATEGSRPDDGHGLLVVSPARSALLDRWADDLERSRFESQRVLAVSLATLAAAGVEAEGRVGDGDPVRAAEDALRSYAATEIVVVSRRGEHDREIAELERRSGVPVVRVEAEAPEWGAA